MTRLALAALLALTSMCALAIDPTPPLSNAARQQRYETLNRQLRCLQCQGETVADTPAKFAVDIRRQVREMVEAGKSDDEIRHYMVDRYGEIILLKPLWSAANSWLWLAPAFFLLGGIFVAWRILRQRRELLVLDTSEVTDEAGHS
ncbi:MAG: cytochrome c-type biogenesis protein [Pseudomonadota bacterium]